MDSMPTVWGIEEHTLAKHQLMRHYIRAWFPILTIQGYNKRVIFLDGFAGPGIYNTGDPGSSFVALEALVASHHFDQLSHTTFDFVFVERRRDRFDRLQEEISEFWRKMGGQPTNVRLHPIRGDFAYIARNVIPSLRQSAPMFAFIDPFGWSVPMSVIRDYLAGPGCEVLFTFMYERVNQFITTSNDNTLLTFLELFHVSETQLRRITATNREERKTILRNLYLTQLQEEAGFKYARAFEIRNIRRNRTIYFLMFGTHSIRGLDRMKRAMWKLDPEQGVLFSGLTSGDPLLFQPEPHYTPLENALQDRFAGETVTVKAVEKYVITDTDYTSSHHKTVLKDFEMQGHLVCMSPRSKRYSYGSDDILRFLPRGQSTKPRLPFD